MNFDYPHTTPPPPPPHWNQWQHFKLHGTDLEVNAIVPHFLSSSSLKCCKHTFTVPSSIKQTASLRLFSHQGQPRKLKKKILSCGRCHSLLVAFRNYKKLVVIVKRRSTAKIKHRGPTSLTFMLLVWGTDWVVRDVCIRCIGLAKIRCSSSSNIVPN